MWAGFCFLVDDKNKWIHLLVICLDDVNSGPTDKVLISLDSEKRFYGSQ